MTESESRAPVEQIVAIHGAPRSGTSWLGQLFNSHERVAYRYQPLFAYAFKGRISETSSSDEILEFFHDLFFTEDDFILQRGGGRLADYDLEFTKGPLSHLIYKEVRYHHLLEPMLMRVPDLFGIGLIRHPCAVINSWVNASREFRPEWNIKEEWRQAPNKNKGLAENFYGYDRWKQLAGLFHSMNTRYPERFYIVKYAELLNHTAATMDRLFDFIGLSATQQSKNFIHASTTYDDGHPYGVFRKRDGEEQWKCSLDPSIIQEIEQDLAGTSLEVYLE